MNRFILKIFNEMTTSGKLDINGWPIWYEKVGFGKNPLLLIPGAIGTGRTDFKYQLEGEHALDYEKFTIIAVEVPGWGRSRPPLRSYGPEVYNIDAECCLKLMQGLGYDKFSVFGWSDGAKVALLMSCIYPKNIKSTILLGIPAFPSQKLQLLVLLTRNVNDWGEDKIDNYLEAYKDQKEIQELWNRHMIFVKNSNRYFPEDICKNKYHRIECPVLIIHGDKDALVPIEQPLHVLTKIKSAKMHRFSSGTHDLHKVFKSEFKKLVENFLNN